MTRRTACVMLAVLLAGCGKPAAAPPPQEVSKGAIAQFCGMSLAEHAGPKGQIFVRDVSTPFWFASVRDTIAFLRLPETPKNVVAVYVNDMARAHDWTHPEPGAWILADRAFYVIGSRRRSGMDTEEAVPFGTRTAAEAFAITHGGRVLRLTEVPDSYIFPEEGTGP